MKGSGVSRGRLLLFVFFLILSLLAASAVNAFTRRDLSGQWQDYGGGWSYIWYSSGDYEHWKYNGNLRFAYTWYNQAWWYQNGLNTWYGLTGGNYSQDFVGDGAFRMVGNNWWFGYDKGSDRSFWSDGSSTSYRFAYNNSLRRWVHYGTSWAALTSTGYNDASFIGNGGWHNIGANWWYAYATSMDHGFWSDGASAKYRFAYNYDARYWVHYGTSWSVLTPYGYSNGFIGDSQWHGLGTVGGAVWQYRYAAHAGTWQQKIADAWTSRFKYDYTSGQWQDNRTDGWHLLGAEGAGCAFLGDGLPHVLNDDFAYTYWEHNVGRWLVDATHYFQYAYTGTAGWSYSLDLGATWSPWAQTTLAADTFEGNSGCPDYFTVAPDGTLYFSAMNSDWLWDLYQWDGSSLTNMSHTGFIKLTLAVDISGVGAYFIGRQRGSGTYDLYLAGADGCTLIVESDLINFLGTSGNISYYSALDPSRYACLYQAQGSNWAQVSTQRFLELDYATEIAGAGLFFSGLPGGSSSLEHYVYRLHDGLLEQITHEPMNLTYLYFSAANSTDLFFTGQYYTSEYGFLFDVWRVWNDEGTWTFANVSNTGFAYAVRQDLFYGQTVNNDVYFVERDKISGNLDLFRWNAASEAWEQVTHVGFADLEWANDPGYLHHCPPDSSVVGGALYLNGYSDTNPDPFYDDFLWAVYRCDADGYSRISDYGVRIEQYAGTIGGIDYWTARAYDTIGYPCSLYAWDGDAFTNVTTNGWHLEFATEAGGALYFAVATLDNFGRPDIYRFNGTWERVADAHDFFMRLDYITNLEDQGLIWSGLGNASANEDLWSYNPDTGTFAQWSEAIIAGYPPNIVPYNRDYYFSGMLEGGDGNELMRRWGDWEYLTGRSVL